MAFKVTQKFVGLSVYNNLKNIAILYIEDDVEVSKHFTVILEKLGVRVFYAKDYHDAKTLFKKNRFDFIITDIRLPDNTGIEFIKHVRSFDTEIPIVITSGYSETEYLLDAIEYDVSKYFIKPFKEMELFEFLDIEADRLKNNQPMITTTVNLKNGFKYSYDKKSFIKNDEDIKLSTQEILLVELLIKNKDKIIEYKTLQEELSKNKSKISLDTLRTVVKNIRKKTYNNIITTLSGIGYKINL